MAVRLRLQRHGSKKRPFYRVVAADSRSPRDGRYIEQLGVYNPLYPEPTVVNLDLERVEHWLSTGAQPSGTVEMLIRKVKAGETRSIQQVEASHRQDLQKRREDALKGIAVPPSQPAAPAAPAESSDSAEA